MKYLTFLSWTLFAALFGLGLGLSGFFLHLNPQIPDVSAIRDVKIKAPLRIFSADNKLIQEFGERLTPIQFADLPSHLVNAVLAIEDKRFFQHGGVDPITLVNASIQLVLNRGAIKGGASTIEMQLYKNISGAREVKFIRKFKEILMALKLDKEISKREILSLYLNIIPYGKHAYGVQAAARTYYGKDLSELNLAQIAMLAGIAKKPEKGNPVNGPDWALERRNLVLQRMLDQDAISPMEYQVAINQPITAKEHSRPIEVSALYVGESVRQQLIAEYGSDVTSRGMSVYTTLDSHIQNAAHQALIQELEAYDTRHGYRGPEYIQLEGTEDFIAWSQTLPETEKDSEEVVNDTTEESGVEARPESIVYPENWINTLNQLRSVKNKIAAIVVEVNDQSIRVIDRNQEILTIEWEGLQWAKPYIDPHTLGSAPEKASEIVAVGDVIRVTQGESKGWKLTQIPEIEGGMIAIDPDSGAIKALVGGYDFYRSQFNHVTQARRQPGSNFKPFFYAGAIEGGMTPATILNDAPIVLDGGELEEVFRPRNAGRFNGEVRLREALFRSLNLVSVRVVLDYGATKAVNYVRRFGFDTSKFPRDIQVALGGGTIALTPLEVARGYAAFANGGYRVDPYLVQAVESLEGEILFKANPAVVCLECEMTTDSDETAQDLLETTTAESIPRPPRIIEARSAYIMDSILADVVKRGTARKALLELGRDDLRGKTGTTNDADIWYSGYNRHMVATVWAGFDDNSPVGNNEWGSTVPLDTWIAFARQALPPETETVPLPEPDGLVRVRIDPKTGFRARPSDPNGIFEIFREENAPAPLQQLTDKTDEFVDLLEQIN